MCLCCVRVFTWLRCNCNFQMKCIVCRSLNSETKHSFIKLSFVNVFKDFDECDCWLCFICVWRERALKIWLCVSVLWNRCLVTLCLITSVDRVQGISFMTICDLRRCIVSRRRLQDSYYKCGVIQSPFLKVFFLGFVNCFCVLASAYYLC